MGGLLRHTVSAEELDARNSFSYSFYVSCDSVLRCESPYGLFETLKVTIFINSYIELNRKVYTQAFSTGKLY